MDFKYLRELFEACLEADYRQVENGGSFATVRDGEILYIFFEKSSGQEDWLNNLSYHAAEISREGEKWFCHEGFLRVWRSILPYIDMLIMNSSVRKVITVGYSHGAALALLCHEQVWYSRPDISADCEGYGFGCPRVVWGTLLGGESRWRNFYVVRNIDDLVTHLPPRTFGYRHVGRLVSVGRRGKYSGIDAHRAENYISELKNAEIGSKTQ